MKIFAIGMNYAAHNQELHGTLKRPDEPVIFTKADSALLKDHKPCVDVVTALDTTIAGVYAHLSAMKDGESLKVPAVS